MSEAEDLFLSIASIQTIRDWIRDGRAEGILLDYKQTDKLDKGSAWKLVGKALSAMANTVGGVVVYGVRTKTLPGDSLDYPESIELTDPLLDQKIRNWANIHIVPPIPGLRLARFEDSSERVIAAFVPQSPLRPHQVREDKIYYRRTADESTPMDHAHVELLFRTRLNMEMNFSRSSRSMRTGAT